MFNVDSSISDDVALPLLNFEGITFRSSKIMNLVNFDDKKIFRVPNFVVCSKLLASLFLSQLSDLLVDVFYLFFRSRRKLWL